MLTIHPDQVYESDWFRPHCHYEFATIPDRLVELGPWQGTIWATFPVQDYGKLREMCHTPDHTEEFMLGDKPCRGAVTMVGECDGYFFPAQLHLTLDEPNTIHRC